MKINPITNNQNINNKPNFNGSFVNNGNLREYVKRMTDGEFYSFQKNHKAMEKVNDGKKYRYEIEKCGIRKFGCIIDENGEYIARELISIYTPNKEIKNFKENEHGLFADVFSRYVKSGLTESKEEFLDRLPKA